SRPTSARARSRRSRSRCTSPKNSRRRSPSCTRASRRPTRTRARWRQTISQPTLVGKMTDALRLHRRSRVLEVGTGCGYQTAILAELASDVWSIELEPALSQAATARLRRLGYRNIETRVG